MQFWTKLFLCKKSAKVSPETEISRKLAGKSIFVQVNLQKLRKAKLEKRWNKIDTKKR